MVTGNDADNPYFVMMILHRQQKYIQNAQVGLDSWHDYDDPTYANSVYDQ